MPKAKKRPIARKKAKFKFGQLLSIGLLIVLLLGTALAVLARTGNFDIRNQAKRKAQPRPNCQEKCVNGIKFEYNQKSNTCVRKACGKNTARPSAKPQNCTSIRSASACGKASDCKWVACNKCIPKSYGPDLGDVCTPCGKYTSQSECSSKGGDYCAWIDGKCIQ